MSFFVKINSFCNIFDLNRKILPCFKRKQEKIREKIRGYVDSEFVETCHEHVKFYVLKWALGEYFEGNELEVILIIFGYFLPCQP